MDIESVFEFVKPRGKNCVHNTQEHVILWAEILEDVGKPMLHQEYFAMVAAVQSMSLPVPLSPLHLTGIKLTNRRNEKRKGGAVALRFSAKV